MSDNFQSSKISVRIYRFVFLAIISSALCILAMVLDPSELIGVSVWLQPMKLWMSFGFYVASLPFLLPMIFHSNRKLAEGVANLTLLCLLGQMVIVTVAAIRVEKTHYNYSTPFHSYQFLVMAIGILAVWVQAVRLTIELHAPKTHALNRETLSSFIRLHCARVAMIIFSIGSFAGNLMTLQKPAVIEPKPGWQLGAHLVGGPDGSGKKIPFLAWSAEFGDLRIAHFVGLHALQIFILYAFLVELRMAKNTPVAQLGGLVLRIRCLGVLFSALFMSTLLQAKSREPITELFSSFGVINSTLFMAILILVFEPLLWRAPDEKKFG